MKVIIVGGGPAGLAAAVALKQKDVCIAKKRVPKALPAIMVHMDIKKTALISGAPLKVVSCVD